MLSHKLQQVFPDAFGQLWRMVSKIPLVGRSESEAGDDATASILSKVFQKPLPVDRAAALDGDVTTPVEVPIVQHRLASLHVEPIRSVWT